MAAAAVICVGILAVRVQLGRAVPGEKTEVWFSNVARMREHLYAKQPPDRPTIWIVSGSNSLFSIASAEMATRTGFNVRNYALHASLHVDLLFSQIRGKVRKGDIVLAPIEWEARERGLVGSQFDYVNYLYHLRSIVNPAPSTLYRLYVSVPLRRWWHGLLSYLSSPRRQTYEQFYPDTYLVDSWESRKPDLNYSHLALTPEGDINIDKHMSKATWDDKSMFAVPAKIRISGLVPMDRWNAYFTNLGAKLMVVSPIMLDGNADTLRLPETWRRIEAWRAAMAGTRAPLHCDPIRSVFSTRYRFDTEYHANADGARLRTAELSDCINRAIAGEDTRTPPIDGDRAAAAVARRLDAQGSVDLNRLSVLH